MNRTIYWSQEQLRSFDLLWFEKDVMAALGGLEVDVAGATTTVAGGLAATQTTVASLTINIAAGRIYQQAAADSSSFGALGADAAVIQQQGYAAAQQVTLSTSGISAGQSRWSLVQAQFSQVDSVRTGDPTGGVLYYYNSSNPSSPFQGPANSGTPNNTVRSGVLVLSVVNGAAATTGSEVPPNPTAGWIPLYLIDLAFGQTAIITAQILTAGPSVGTNVPSNYPGAPILAGLLNSHHSGGAGNAPKIKLTSEVQGILPLANLPASSAPAGGGLSTVQTYAGNPNTHVAGNAGVVGTSPPDLVWDTTDGAWWTCTTTGNAAAAVWTQTGGSFGATIYSGDDSGTATALDVATVVPPITSYVKYQVFLVKLANDIGSNATVVFGSLAPKSIIYEDGTKIRQGDYKAGAVLPLFYDGTNMQVAGQVPLPTKLLVAANYYVDPTIGSDTLYDGTQATISGSHGPWATLNKAWTWLQQNINANSQLVTINCAFPNNPTSYAQFTPIGGITGVFSSGQVIILGDTTNYHCQISISSANAGSVQASSLALFTIKGFNLISTGTLGVGLFISGGAQVLSDHNLIGVCSAYGMQAAGSGSQITFAGSGLNSFNGNCLSSIRASEGASVQIGSSTINYSAGLSFSGGTVSATDASGISASTTTFTGSVPTGPKWDIEVNSYLQTNGALNIPGSTAGTTATGGQAI